MQGCAEVLGGTEAIQHVRSVLEVLVMLRRLLVLGCCWVGPSLPASGSPE